MPDQMAASSATTAPADVYVHRRAARRRDEDEVGRFEFTGNSGQWLKPPDNGGRYDRRLRRTAQLVELETLVMSKMSPWAREYTPHSVFVSAMSAAPAARQFSVTPDEGNPLLTDSTCPGMNSRPRT